MTVRHKLEVRAIANGTRPRVDWAAQGASGDRDPTWHSMRGPLATGRVVGDSGTTCSHLSRRDPEVAMTRPAYR